jgi:antitoxin (DNA-binding transcriptional repressor) of toxin-antitoxin stability system
MAGKFEKVRPMTRGAAAAGIAAALLIAAAMPAQAEPAAVAAKAKKKQSSAQAQRERLRRELARQVKRNPSTIFSKSFLKKADLVDFRLPLTVRLTDGNGVRDPTGDQLEISWDDSVTPWPAFGMAPATQTMDLKGQFTMELSYGDEASGYGELGAMEALQGAQISMQGSPITIADFPGCPSGPQLRVAAGSSVSITSAGARYGLLNPFSQRFRGTLALRMSFASEFATSCDGGYTTTQAVNNSQAPPMPVRFDGTFRTSPAVTSDGKVRFGEIEIDDAATPQVSSFAYIRSCTSFPDCTPAQFPARLKLKRLRAEVLLGDVGAG